MGRGTLSFGVQGELGSALTKAATTFPGTGQPESQNPSKGMRQMKPRSWVGKERQEILSSKKTKKKGNEISLCLHPRSQTWREEIQLCQAGCGISALPQNPQGLR